MNNHYGWKKVTPRCALIHLSLIPRPRLIQIITHINLHLNSTWIHERKQAIFLCHQPLLITETADLL